MPKGILDELLEAAEFLPPELVKSFGWCAADNGSEKCLQRHRIGSKNQCGTAEHATDATTAP